MTTENIKNRLHKYVDNGDEKLLKLMYAVAKEYSTVTEEFIFSPEDLALFEQRRNSRLQGKSELYSWDEAKALIKSKRSA